MATHSSTLAWKIPWTEEPGGLQFMGSWRVGHDWATSLSLFTFIHWRRKWQPTPLFLPGESRDRQAWWAAIYGVTKSRTWLSNFTFTFMHWRRKWQSTPVFLPGESQARASLVGCCLWGRTESDTTEATYKQQQQGYIFVPLLINSVILGKSLYRYSNLNSFLTGKYQGVC